MRHIHAQTDGDLSEVQEDWEEALAELLATWESISASQRAELVDQVRDAVDAGDIEALGSLSLDTDDPADELAAAMEALAETAAQGMADEAAEQGVEVAAGTADAAELAPIAAAMAALLGTGLATSAGIAALRFATPGRSGREVAADVDQHLAALSTSWLTAHLGGALSAAQARGRLATLEIAPPAVYEASEILDRNVCGPCAEEDGTIFETLEDAWIDYGNGVYIYCEGGWRCRGQITAVWDE